MIISFHLRYGDFLKILFVYPQYPDTFWSFKHALKFVSKKAASATGLGNRGRDAPNGWEKKLVDMNTMSLSDRDIKWADFVFISAMVGAKRIG